MTQYGYKTSWRPRALPTLSVERAHIVIPPLRSLS